MELEFNGTRLSGYHLTVNTTLFSEETLESIVPDACPDILHILSTNAMVCLRAKETREGHLEARGAVYAQVLYVPEGEEGVRHIEVSIPFTCGLDHSGVSADSVLHAVPRVVRADARMLNPRKVYVRAELALKVACYQPYQKKLLSHCGAGVEYGLQEKREDCRLCTIKTVQSKTFTFSDDLVLPGSKPDLEELLCVRVTAACAESKVIGSRLIFKGQAVAEALYRSAEGQLSTASFELPFSQLMDVADTAEEAECDFEIVLNELTCHADREDPRLISLSVSLIAQAVLRETQSVTLLSDLYSTSYTLSAEFQEEELCDPVRAIPSGRSSVR